MMFMAYGVGQIIAPHFFLASQAPTYAMGFQAFYVCVALMIAIEIAMMWAFNSSLYIMMLMISSIYYLVENHRRDKKAAEIPAGTETVAYDFLDLTDREHIGFRYVF